jgi:hypothetical protein
MNMNIVERKKMKMKNRTEYKMGLGLPRGSKVIVKAGNRQADIRLVELEDGGHNWKLQIDRDLPETEYPSLENAILSAQTLFREVI